MKIPRARINAPINRKISGSANDENTTFGSATFRITHSAAPTSALTGIGIGSVIHSTITLTITAAPDIAPAVTALAVEENVPAGWAYMGVSGSPMPMERLDGSLVIRLRGKYLNFKQLPAKPEKIKNAPFALPAKSKAHAPAANHPWRGKFAKLERCEKVFS